MENRSTSPSDNTKEILWISILLGITGMRAFMGFQLPSLQMFGGINPDAWLAPWLSDTILGILVPLMIYLTLRKNGVEVWGILVAYNAIGAFDYVHGLMAEFTDPLIPNGLMGSPELVYGSIGFSLALQCLVLFFLFKPNMIRHFIGDTAFNIH